MKPKNQKGSERRLANKLVRRLQLSNLLMVASVTLLMAIVFSLALYTKVSNERHEHAATLARLLEQNIQAVMSQRDAKKLTQSLSLLNNQPGILGAKIYDEMGQLRLNFQVTDTMLGGRLRDETQLSRATYSNSEPPAPTYVANDYAYSWLDAWTHLDTLVEVRDEQGGDVLLGHLVLTTDMRSARQDMLWQIASIFTISLVGFMLMAYRLKKITYPIESMLSSLRRVTPSQHSPQAIRRESAAPGSISGVFNAMVDEIEAHEKAMELELQHREHMATLLATAANFDPVTKLPNRHAFNSEIEQAYQRYTIANNNFALLFIDLDNFKYVNDNYGHAAGDALLLCVGERIRHLLRAEDFVARIGGDEFVVILNGFKELEQISLVAEKIITALRLPFQVEGKAAYIGASIGITTCPNHCINFADLLKQADSAMYLAKNSGKNNFQYFNVSLAVDLQLRVKLENELRVAVVNQEIEVHYQPIIDLVQQQLIGFEALLRWTLADGTLVAPDQFLPLAEELGLMPEIGERMVQQCITQTKIWHAQHANIYTAINFSSSQLTAKSFAGTLCAMMTEAGLQTRHIEIELSESVLMKNTTESHELLKQLNVQGFPIAIDDFGTVYSSLSHLAQFPAQKLKIDQRFIAQLPHHTQSVAIVSAIIGLANSLGLTVVAEGIENREQLHCLQALGCQLGQGFLFSSALSAIAATELLHRDFSLV
jgi:diguanylate cyclase (GGDEF)-like protein